MIRPIMKDPIFLAQKSAQATVSDMAVARDLRDTLEAHRDGCVGMAANMIGTARRIIIFDDNGSVTVMPGWRMPWSRPYKRKRDSPYP